MGHKFKNKETGKWCVVRCDKCERENYAPAVSSGVCVWCGWDENAQDYTPNTTTIIKQKVVEQAARESVEDQKKILEP